MEMRTLDENLKAKKRHITVQEAGLLAQIRQKKHKANKEEEGE